MKLGISALGHARQLKFRQLCSCSIYKPNIVLWSHSSDYVQCRRGLHGLYVLALEHAGM